MSGSKPGDSELIPALAAEMAKLAKLPPSSVTIDRPRKPPQHNEWCALHHGKTTCDCDWFEKEGRT